MSMKKFTADINTADEGWTQVTISGLGAEMLTERQIETALSFAVDHGGQGTVVTCIIEFQEHLAKAGYQIPLGVLDAAFSAQQDSSQPSANQASNSVRS